MVRERAAPLRVGAEDDRRGAVRRIRPRYAAVSVGTPTWLLGFFRSRIARPFEIAVIAIGERYPRYQAIPGGSRGGYRYNVRRVDVFVTLERVHENPGASQKSG
ncbi:hypothetical protein BN2476_640147 [Paraburkholderia piptadeniae]|uniref:Uncharacterized protein n=1 Tax=Paraburkholderia piptadeniae TaxID=1701573 RepID=A0A1N7SMT0_9BURK|nr:hypothetical protein BN2476_640147 [Paraburkholderia piptadeniae]